MKLSSFRLIRGVLIGWALIPACALACAPEQDGCLGCSDDELPVCLGNLVDNVCQTSGNPANCDSMRVYDDAERYVLINTGNHMSRIRAMFRSSRKYQHR
jgi:hypothetical protein